MPLQNRVNPFGGLDAVAARGAWLGNRGIIHNERKEIVVQWRSKAWITCRLHYPGVHRTVFSPHTWSELFFLDEATAFAAGHRPCAYCRRQRYHEFKRAWCNANRDLLEGPAVSARFIDARLHAERVTPQRTKRTWTARIGGLPPGTFIAVAGRAYVLWRGRWFAWSHWGYRPARPVPHANARAEVLTPRSIVAMFAGGFRPQVHASAAG